MNIFTIKVLIYISFHLIGLFLGIVTILGTPGQLSSNRKIIPYITKLLNFLAIFTFKGTPFLLVVSILFFYLGYDLVAKVFSFISLGVGLLMVISMICLHTVQEKSR